MHRCAAQCCDNETYSIQKIHNCVENCNSSLNKAQQYVQGEFERVQVIKFTYLIERIDDIREIFDDLRDFIAHKFAIALYNLLYVIWITYSKLYNMDLEI